MLNTYSNELAAVAREVSALTVAPASILDDARRLSMRVAQRQLIATSKLAASLETVSSAAKEVAFTVSCALPLNNRSVREFVEEDFRVSQSSDGCWLLEQENDEATGWDEVFRSDEKTDLWPALVTIVGKIVEISTLGCPVWQVATCALNVRVVNMRS